MLRTTLLRSLGAAALLMPALAAGAAHAQDRSVFQRDRTVGVRDRGRPDYDALGLRAGSFLLFPKAELSEAYEDNVFAAEVNPQSDWVTSFSPSLTADSQWSRHSLSARLAANTYRYATFDQNSSTTYSAGLNGRLDLIQGTAATGRIAFDHLVEPRASASSPTDAVDPVRYNQTSLDFGLSREVSRIRLSGAIHYRDYTFQDTRSFAGAPISEQYRNNHSWEGNVRADYAISPALAVYATALHNKWSFNPPASPTDVNRDSSGYQAAVGADFEVTQLVRGQVQVGFMNQSFEDARVPDGDGFSTLGRVEYFPTQLLTLTANVERTVQSTGVIGAGGVVHTAGGLQADYELLRNLILTARANRLHDSYRGLDRKDKIWTMALGANYLVNRRVGLNVLYTRYEQDSTGLQRGRNFTTSRIQVGIVGQY